jgi:hypothetical protein
MRAKLRYAASIAVAVSLAAAALRCNPFGNGDSPPELVGPGGTFSVTPCGVTFDVVNGASEDAGGPSQTFVMIGQMAAGLGAEGLPITVAIGECPGDGGGTHVAGLLAAAGPGQACGSSDLVLQNNGQIELAAAAGSGCAVVSTSLLTCLLRADGTAAFSVTATLPMTSTSGLVIPVCVSPNDVAPTQIPVAIASVIDGGSLAIGAPGQIPPSQLPAPANCSDLIPSASLVGLSSSSTAACSIARTAPVSIQLLQGDAGPTSRRWVQRAARAPRPTCE